MEWNELSKKEKQSFSEADVCRISITPSIHSANWDSITQIREQYYFTDGNIEVNGNKTKRGKRKFADYVLYHKPNIPLAIVEAKDNNNPVGGGMQQALEYAEILDVPFAYSSNGDAFIEHDRTGKGDIIEKEISLDKFPTPEILWDRYKTHKGYTEEQENIVTYDYYDDGSGRSPRYYQVNAINRTIDAIAKGANRILLVMATGTGKTRTIISLCDLLIRCNWIKRVLFLADRKNLVSQAEKAFKKHLPDCSPVNLVKNKSGEGRIFLSTYPTISNLIDNQFESGKRRFGIGHFDLVIIDEAHRSVYKKYYSIFEYFDSLLIGLTATPKDEIDRNTYGLFDLDIGMPTDEYSYAEAIKDNFLTPFKGLSIPLKFVREGIKYDELSEDEKEEWEEIEWETEEVPEQIYSGQINKILFNSDTVDKVLKHLWEYGQRGEDPDRIGKTIIFAKNQKHAEFIEERFDKNFPHLKGHTLRVISHAEKYSETLIEEFSDVNNPLDIGVSIDMLDTGLDIPEIVNLVFFKLVRSRTKFWQMIGRGTRLCPNLFGPGEEKKFFWIFDYCQNLEFFSMNNGNDNVQLQETISSKLFKSKVEILQELDRAGFRNINEKFISEEFNNLPKNNFELRAQFAGMLKAKVCSCNKNNFIVRPNLEDVEKFEKTESWYSLSQADKNTLDYRISNLPFTIEEEDPDAKKFDLLIYKIELALLKQDPSFISLKLQVMELAEQLLTRERVPQVLENLEFIREIRTQEWWEDINLIMLEEVRRKIRGLINFIERESKKPLYTNFRDTIGEGEIIDNKQLIETDEFEEFRQQTRNICKKYEDNLTIQRLKKNKALTQEDLNQLEAFLIEQNIGDKKMIDEVIKREHSLGLFIRKLIGLDRTAAIEVFSEFLNDGIYSSKQIQFINEIINYLTQHGVMDIGRIYEQPFNEIASSPEDLFKESDLDKICSLIKFVKERAEVPLAA